MLNDMFAKVAADQKTDIDTGRNFWTSTPATPTTVCNIGCSNDYLDTIFELKENGSFVRPVSGNPRFRTDFFILRA